MSYYVHEKPLKNGAVIHKEDCRHCHGAYGRDPDTNPNANRWYGPFDNLAEAMQRGKATGQKYIRRCRVCLRKQNVDLPW